MKRFYFIQALILSLSVFVSAQNQTSSNIYHNWYNKSASADQIYGVEVDIAYDTFLKNKKSETVIVAVIDGGIDINHEDLKDNIWTNPNEIADNGIDDDKNGYIDDIHGWNFLGNDKGENIAFENLEVTRIYKQYKGKYENIDSKSIPENEKEAYNLFKHARSLYYSNLNDAKQSEKRINSFENRFNESYKKISEFLGKDTLVLNDFDTLNTNDQELLVHFYFLQSLFMNDFTVDVLDEMKNYSKEALEYHLNLDYNPRDIIGDDPTDISKPYGNSNVYGPEAFHGTFVAGIIAAKRNNGIGINGIADNVKIMALKTVPNGDERDKDVAKAIRYAADNGARIINMSFGKEMSPQKYLVDEAFKYAEEKGVLIIHAAGNDGYNIDKVKQYPTKKITSNNIINNWITVGASSISLDLEFAADFTNYGKKTVDVFAPGVQVESLAPENNYEIADGTSFSCPVVSGVAALIMSYYPNLSAQDVKTIILNSATNYSNIKVYRPGDYSKKAKKVRFKTLSSTGGLVNAYNAIKLAEEL